MRKLESFFKDDALLQRNKTLIIGGGSAVGSKSSCSPFNLKEEINIIMKKVVILLSVFLFVLNSCSNEIDNNVYSDDLSVDTWVKANRKMFNDVDLKGIASYYGEEQRAIFRLIEPEVKKALWIEKFNILRTKFVGDEKQVFVDFYDFVKKLDFSKNFSQSDLNYINGVVKNGQEKFNWSDEFVGITFCSFEFVKADSNYNIFKFASRSNGIGEDMETLPELSLGGGKPICNCKWGGMFACGSMDCKNVECKDDGKKGCGFLLLETCTAKCQM